MKRITILNAVAIIMLSATFVFTSCSSDDDDKTTNYIEYNGEQDDLTKGTLEYYGMGEGTGYNFDITLLSPNISWETETGVGSGVYFELFSSSETELPSGTYTFSQTQNPLTFDDGGFIFNFNIATEEGIDEDITDGTVKITNGGSTYTIEFNCTSTSGKTVKGHYSGALTYEDFSDMKAAKIKKSIF